ncbi:tautomerase family protein [Jatrophihabitans sp. YIM 134969]
MPFANYKVPQGTLTAAQKEEIVHRTTDLLVSLFGEDARPHTMVLVEEVADGGWGRADEVLTLASMGIEPS